MRSVVDMRPILTSIAIGLSATLAAAGCGDEASGTDSGDAPVVVVTSTILGNIVETVAGDAAEVEVLLPRGADPHEFSLSVRQAESMSRADLLVENGGGVEEGMTDSIATAAESGVELFTLTDHVDLIDDDPHVWTDPTRLLPAVEALGARLADVTGDPAVLDRAAAYAEDLAALDDEIEATLAGIPAAERVLVTNHEVLTYFADRYEFEVVGAFIASPSTRAQPSAADLDDLADTIEAEGVPAIFVETSSNADLAEALADTVGDVAVVTLYTESLGEPGSGAETYLDMLRTNAALIRDALTDSS